MNSATTLPRLLYRNVANSPNRPAFREKRGGIWQVLTWSDYAAMVSRLAAGLVRSGFGRGDRLAVIGDNRPRLYAAMLAAQSLGGTAVPLWPDAEPDWLAQTLNHAGVSIVVAEDAEQVDKIVSCKDRIPRLRYVVQAAAHGMRLIHQDWLVSFEAFCDEGPTPTELSEPADTALLLYGNATGVDPCGRTLTHAELLAAADAIVAAEDVRLTDETLAWLPMAWFGDALASQVLALAVGFTCNCPEHPDTVYRDLREIGPTILTAPPRIWESMLADIEARMTQATPLKRALLRRFGTLADSAERLRSIGARLPLLMRAKLALGEALVYAPLRDQTGLRRLRWASTGGEPLAPGVLQGFRALGVNLKQSHTIPAQASSALEPAHA